jgi:hypothetical protein
MSTPKELSIQIGDAARFKQGDASNQFTELFASLSQIMPQVNELDLALDADVTHNGLVARCVNIVERNTTVYLFKRVRLDGELGDIQVPVNENTDCIETIVYGPYQL